MVRVRYTKKWTEYIHLNPILIPVKSSTYLNNIQKLSLLGITVKEITKIGWNSKEPVANLGGVANI